MRVFLLGNFLRFASPVQWQNFSGISIRVRVESSFEGLKVSVGDYIRNSQIWKSVFRHPALPIDVTASW